MPRAGTPCPRACRGSGDRDPVDEGDDRGGLHPRIPDRGDCAGTGRGLGLRDGSRQSTFADIGAEEAARIIAGGLGLLGTNLKSFDNLATHVEALGIKDAVFEDIRSGQRRQKLHSL
jgi:hypothetical protein